MRVDRFDRQEDPWVVAEMERRTASLAKDELRDIIFKQRMQVGKNTRLYKAMKSSKVSSSI